MTVLRYFKNELQITDRAVTSSVQAPEKRGIWPASPSPTLFISPVPGVSWVFLQGLCLPGGSLAGGLTEATVSDSDGAVQVAGSAAHLQRGELRRSEESVILCGALLSCAFPDPQFPRVPREGMLPAVRAFV